MPRASDLVLDEIIDDLAAVSGDVGVSSTSVLDDVLPDDMVLEKFVHAQEQKYGTQLSDRELVGAFSTWTVRALAACLTGHLMAKVASDQGARQKAHQRYMAMRGLHLQRSKSYRLMHMHQIRRKAKAYRRKVKRKIVRPQRRVGTAAGGFSFVAR